MSNLRVKQGNICVNIFYSERWNDYDKLMYAIKHDVYSRELPDFSPDKDIIPLDKGFGVKIQPETLRILFSLYCTHASDFSTFQKVNWKYVQSVCAKMKKIVASLENDEEFLAFSEVLAIVSFIVRTGNPDKFRIFAASM